MMLSTWPRRRSIKIIQLILSLCLTRGITAADTCEDPTWPDDLVVVRRADTSLTTSSSSVNTITDSAVSTSSSISNSLSSTITTSPTTSVTSNSASSSISISSSSPTASPIPDLLSKISSGNITAGEINCRWTDYTDADVNYYTCTQLAQNNNIDVETFFRLNPEIDADCGNIEPNSVYCVRGFIEPVRTTAGLCGPPNDNASCAGYDGGQCCNSETWTCGNSTTDCADGICYEGSCLGDSVYTTDGTCGSNYGDKQCTGKWGDCCNVEGRCGSGDAFCAWGNCNSGNCSVPIPAEEPLPSWMRGNTTDGTCGPASGFSCNVLYGFCCNKDGKCGSSAADCGVGCQSDWGDCNNVTVPTTTSRTTTKSSSTSSTSSLVSFTSSTSTTSTTSSTTLPAITSLPSCGQTCFNNLIATYSSLGCSTPDPSCMCSNVNFGYGIRDCSNAVCGAVDASAVIAYESQYCASALATATAVTTISTSATKTTSTSSTTALTSLPTCGQTCFNNMLAQYSSLGCASPDPYCLCSNVNFGYGLRDCSNGACGTDVASTVIAYGSAYCAAATATATVTRTTTALSSLPTCGQTCFNNMVGQYSALGCASPDPYCLCGNVNFGYGLRDCSNGACGTDVASTVIAYGSAYCAAATATASA